MKNILKDEIIYLFKNEYDEFKECSNYIDNFQCKNNFFDLIINIIKNFCKNKSKKYIFIFDQYKAKLDPNESLKELNNTLIKNSEKYGLIICCSMDNKSVRELKIKYLSNKLFKEKNLNKDADNIFIKDVKIIFDISDFTTDNEELYENILIKIGKTLKNYVALNQIFRKKNRYEIEDFIDNFRKKRK